MSDRHDAVGQSLLNLNFDIAGFSTERRTEAIVCNSKVLAEVLRLQAQDAQQSPRKGLPGRQISAGASFVPRRTS